MRNLDDVKSYNEGGEPDLNPNPGFDLLNDKKITAKLVELNHISVFT
jgi:hypothetical protein